MTDLDREQIDFEGEGLLDGLESKEQRDARLDLLRQLSEAGVGLDQLKSAVADDRLAALPIEHVFTRDCRYTLREAMEEVGFSEAFVRRNYLALGLPLPELDEVALDDDDMESWRMLKLLFDADVSEESILQMARLSGRASAQMADLLMEIFVGRFLSPGDTERDFGLRFAELASNLNPALGPLMERPMRLHLRDKIRREVIGRTELASGELPDTREVGVCFADLVGFTELSERLTTAELGQVTGRLETLAAEVAAPPVRLIKLIGDEAMLVAPDVDALVEAARKLVESADAESDLPGLHVGIAAGAALNRGGDWYGHPVNLASRITAIADAGSIFADEAVVRASADDKRWSEIGKRELKGIEGEVVLYRLSTDATL